MATATKQPSTKGTIETKAAVLPTIPVPAPRPPVEADEPECLAIDGWTLWITLALIVVMWVLNMLEFFGVTPGEFTRIVLW